MKRRFLAIVLGICLTAGSLSGCGGKSGRAVNEAQDGGNALSSAQGSGTAESGTKNGDSTSADAFDGTYANEMPMENAGEEAECDLQCDAATDDSLWNDGGYFSGEGMAEAMPPQDGEMCVLPPYDEEYAEIVENGFVSAAEQPFSTFSADVDTASYSNLRRMIMDGYAAGWIPADSIRIEEMVNYFSYDYEGPRGGEPFGVNPEIAACPWNRESYLVRIGLQTEAVDFSDAAPSNLVFLIDVSGSMYSEDKLPLLQQSFAMLTSNLTSGDRVSIVTYAGDDRVVLTGAKGSDTQRIVDALNALEASGSTNGSAGIETAYEIAQEYFIEGGNNRVILATDGDLNVGLTTVDELERLVAEKKRSGIFLSVLGFGTGNIKDNKMEALADKGNGNYAYIDSLNEARKVLVEEMGATLVTVAKDVKLQMEFNDDIVSEYRLIGYENRALAKEDFEDDSKDAGEIGAGHSVTALYEIRLVRSGAARGAIDGDIGTLHIRYKEPDSERSRQLDYEIGSDAYAQRSSDDFRFAVSVAAFGMILRGSEYCGDLELSDMPSLLGGIDVSGDEYKEEFVQLVRMLIENDAWEEEYDDGWY